MIAITEVIRNRGFLNALFISLGPIMEPNQILYTDTAVLIGMSHGVLMIVIWRCADVSTV